MKKSQKKKMTRRRKPEQYSFKNLKGGEATGSTARRKILTMVPSEVRDPDRQQHDEQMPKKEHLETKNRQTRKPFQMQVALPPKGGSEAEYLHIGYVHNGAHTEAMDRWKKESKS